MTDADLVTELRDEWHRLMRHSIDKGSADAGMAANLAERAANEIEALRECVVDARRDFARAYIRANKAEADLAEALKVIEPLVAISKAYDANELDDGARRYWGPNLEFEEFRGPNQIELYAGRGGKELLTLGHCKAASAFAVKHGAPK